MTQRHVEYRGVHWDVEDLVTENGPEFQFWNQWEVSGFEAETLDLIDQYVKPGTTFVDVGAWVGPFSMWAARTGARVVSVEPDPLASRYLHKHIEANYPNSNVTIVDAALNDATGTCHIQPHEYGWGSCMTRLAPEGLEVPSITLPDLFDLCDIDDCSLVKIDIEGGEAIVLESAAPFLASMGIPLLVGMHEPWQSRPVDYSWFDGFKEYSELDNGDPAGWRTVLALP